MVMVTGHLTLIMGSFHLSGKSSTLAAINGEIEVVITVYVGCA